MLTIRERSKELQTMFELLEKQCATAGLTNLNKTKPHESQEVQIKIERETVDKMGQVISFLNSSNKEVKRRISAAEKVLVSLSFEY